jgi:hypothetical protein
MAHPRIVFILIVAGQWPGGGKTERQDVRNAQPMSQLEGHVLIVLMPAHIRFLLCAWPDFRICDWPDFYLTNSWANRRDAEKSGRRG